MKYNLEDMSRSELEQAIDEWILNERDRQIKWAAKIKAKQEQYK